MRCNRPPGFSTRTISERTRFASGTAWRTCRLIAMSNCASISESCMASSRWNCTRSPKRAHFARARTRCDSSRSTPVKLTSGYLRASRAMISAVPQPTSRTRAPSAGGLRAKMGSSCGQMASACAARLRTIDSSAISLAWGLLGFMKQKINPARPPRSWRRTSFPGPGGAILLGHLCEEVGQGLPGRSLELLVRELEPLHPIETEIAEAVAHLAPGRERPGLAPVREPERVDGAFASSLGFVDVVEAGLALLADGTPQVLQAGAEAIAEVEVGREQRRGGELRLQARRQDVLDLLQAFLRRPRQLDVGPGPDDARSQ